MSQLIPEEIAKVQVKIWFPSGKCLVFRTIKPREVGFVHESNAEHDNYYAITHGAAARYPTLIEHTLKFEIEPSLQNGTLYRVIEVDKGSKVPPWDEVRPTMTEWGIGMAVAAATRGECTRRKVGAVVLNKHKRLVGAGYNGAPAKRASCLEGACPRAKSGVEPGSSYDTGPGACIAIHAEANALLDAGRSARGGELFVSTEICDGCLKLARGSGIAWVHSLRADGTIDSAPIR